MAVGGEVGGADSLRRALLKQQHTGTGMTRERETGTERGSGRGRGGEDVSGKIVKKVCDTPAYVTSHSGSQSIIHV